MGSGSKKVTSGYNYFGSYAIAICHGVSDDSEMTLHKITNGDTVVWEGPIESSSADVNGCSVLTTALGQIEFYWGIVNQGQNATLTELQINFGSGPVAVPIPSWRHICFAVCIDLAFGQQVQPPTLVFHMERRLQVLDISTHEVNGNAVVPEAIYDLLVNTRYGAESVDLDVESFEAAAETTIEEGLGCSPDIDQFERARDLIGRLLSYIDGYLYIQGGKIKIGLLRETSTVGLQTIGMGDMLDEPRPAPDHFDGTWNRTVVTFVDRDNKWEESSELHEDPANAAIVGRSVQKEFNFPWITDRATAKKLAKLIGIRGGLPSCFWELTLKPAHRTIVPGDRFKLTYGPFGITERLVRVKSVTIHRGSSSGGVSVTVQEEQTRSTENDYVPPEDEFAIPGILDGDGSDSFEVSDTTPRLSWLPDDLKETFSDGILVCCNRPDAFTVGGTVYWTWNDGLQAYRSLANLRGFPAKATLLAWHQIRSTNWSFRVQPDSALDYDWLQTLAETETEVYCVVGQRDYKSVGSTKDEHQVLGPWLRVKLGGRFSLVSDTIIDIELEGGQFGTLDLLLETLGSDGRYPCLHVYFGRERDFFIHPSDTFAFERNEGNAVADTDFIRKIKVVVGNHVNEQSLAEVEATEFDRNDATQCADGTLSRDWGERAKTAYEVLDEQAGATVTEQSAPDYAAVEDLDLALGAIVFGTETADQTLLVATVDDVLGAMVSADQRFYND